LFLRFIGDKGVKSQNDDDQECKLFAVDFQ
jgi:hypothetical protein